MNRRDPRIRRTLDDLSTTFDNLTTTTQTAAFSFSRSYLDPCLQSISACLDTTCAPCVAYRRDRARARRQRHFSRASTRPELVFDFYNDTWDDEDDEDDERTGLLGGWGAGDVDRIVAGSGGQEQPRNHRRAMNYGARDNRAGAAGGRSRAKSLGRSGEADPTLVPGSSMFGFLERLPWKIGGRGLRYKPSAANLEGLGKDGEERRTEGDFLLDDSEDTESWGEGVANAQRHKRQRSGTVASADTMNSLSSRGDLFPSDEEDDAVALDDDFAMPLERRNTEDTSSGPRSSKSRLKRTFSGFTTASRSSKSSKNKNRRRSDIDPGSVTPASETRTPASEVKMSLESDRLAGGMTSSDSLPTMEELEQEDVQVREEEEIEVERKREEAQHVAAERGLVSDGRRETAVEIEEEEDLRDQGKGIEDGGADQAADQTPVTPRSDTTILEPAAGGADDPPPAESETGKSL